jgi:hypothetical protein
MLTRFGLIFAVVCAFGLATAVTGSQVAAQTPEKFVTIDPTSGPAGTVVTAELFNGLPNDDITVIFKIPGDPVLATGTTDANGYAKFTFTIPHVVGGGSQLIFFTNFKCSCQISVPFDVHNVRPTPTPTRTPTLPPTSTPVTPPATSTAVPTATATATPTRTPAPPVLGTTPFDGTGSGPNLGVLALGFLSVVTVLAWFTASRLARPQFAIVRPDPAAPDYSTELDLESLEAMRRPFRPVIGQAPGFRGAGWAVGAGLSALAGIFLLRRK